MCGISGFASKVFDDSFCSKLKAASAELSSRGPDGTGLFFDARRMVGLAHNRLAIVDLSSFGDQPFFSQDKKVGLVFNGEIYNYLELKELYFKNRIFVSTSDTEVLLAMFEKFGIAMLDKLQGMFAIAIFDFRTDELFLVRDRFGIKPLYFSFDGNTLSFASQLNALQLLTGKNEKMLYACYHFLVEMAVPAPFSILKECYKLPAGFFLQFKLADFDFKVQKWFDVSLLLEGPLNNPSLDCLRDFVVGLQGAVKKHVEVADVEVAIFLSSGVDSSLLAVIASKYKKLTALHLHFSEADQSLNELARVKKLAAFLNISLIVVSVTNEDLQKTLIEVSSLIDDPLADLVCVSFFILCREAKKHGFKVVLSGEGADEVFFGYELYFKHLWLEAVAKFVPNFLLKKSAKLFSGYKFLAVDRLSADKNSFLSGSINFFPAELNWLKQLIFANKKELQLFLNILKKFFGDSSLNFDLFDFSSWRKKEDSSAENHILLQEFSHRLPELLLMRCDKIAMLHGVEIRVPFLDHLVVEAALKIPLDLRSTKAHPKFFLKNLLSELLGQEFNFWTKKVGFTTPLGQSGKYDKNKAKEWACLQLKI